MLDPLHIVIDTREQSPWAWEPYQVVSRVQGLTAGDYALERDTEQRKGKESLSVRFAIERKSLEDFLGTIAGGWPRFVRELDRMDNFPSRIVIVEGSFEQCCFAMENGILKEPQHKHPQLSPQFVARRVAELALMNVTTLFAGNSQYAAALAYRIFVRRDEQCRLK